MIGWTMLNMVIQQIVFVAKQRGKMKFSGGGESLH